MSNIAAPKGADRRPRTEADKLKAAGIIASRLNLTLLEPEVLTLITDPQHPLYDARVHIAVDPESPLYRDIAARGVEKAIEVRKNGQDKDGRPILQVVDGRQRVQILLHVNAHLPAGQPKRKVPVNFVTGQDRELVLRGLSSNLLRVEETPYTKFVKCEKARSLGCGLEEIALACNLRTTKPIEELFLIGNFVPEVQQAFNGELAVALIKTFAKVPREEQLDALTKLRSSGAKNSRQGKAAVEAARDGEQLTLPEKTERAWKPGKVEQLRSNLCEQKKGIDAELKELHAKIAQNNDTSGTNRIAVLSVRRDMVTGAIHALNLILGLTEDIIDADVTLAVLAPAQSKAA
jgi:ParB family chromosome partitioning protein